MRYDTVFLDVDGTLLYVDLDVEGYVRDLGAYTSNGPLTVERASGPVWESMHRHIKENIKHRDEESLAGFKRRNAQSTAKTLGISAPVETLTEVADRRISFNPYPESERVMDELRTMGAKLYAVSNWDIQLEGVLENLGWLRFFDGVIVSAVVGSEKPDGAIFEEALRASGRSDNVDRVIHVGNDPITDIFGASERGIASVFVDRRGDGIEAPGATHVLSNLTGLPALVRG